MKLITYLLIFLTIFFANKAYSQNEKIKDLMRDIRVTEDNENYNIAKHCENKKLLIVPNGIKYIIGGMFNFQCTKLEKVILPKSLEEIGGSSFANLIELKEVVIPEGVTRIGYNAFEDCQNLKKVTLPKSLLEIGDDAFAGCTELKDIIFPNELKRIGARAFNGCVKFTKIVIPDSVKFIGTNAFSNCQNLEFINIPRDTKLGLNIFNNTEKLKIDSEEEFNDVYINCSNIKKLIIPNGIRIIDDYTFDGCKNIEEIVFPNSLKYISGYAFRECSNIKELNIPYSVEVIGYKAFEKCSSLEKINFVENLEKSSSSLLFGLILTSNMVPKFTWSESLISPISFIIRGSQPELKVIHDKAFNSCINLKNVIIPSTIQEPIHVENPSQLNNGIMEILHKRIFTNCNSIEKINFINRDISIEEAGEKLKYLF